MPFVISKQTFIFAQNKTARTIRKIFILHKHHMILQPNLTKLPIELNKLKITTKDYYSMQQKKSGYWTKEHCAEEAKKYQNRSSFCKGSNGAYTAALKHSWLDEICSHMEVRWQKKWDTKAKCAKEAKKYKNRTDFQRYSPGAWNAANKHNWLDEICSHMETYGNLFLRCIYAFEFSDISVYIGLTDNIQRREKQHLKSSNSAVYKHIQKTSLTPILQILHEYTDKELAKTLEKFYIEDYRSKGWNILNRAKAGSLGGKYVFWTYEECKSHALQCSTRSEFITKHPGAYASAIKNKWLDDICQHMELKFEIKNDSETVRLEAQKYRDEKNIFKD